MGAERFYVSSINPNNAIGGGGCACSPLANPDQAGPYAIFPASETDNNQSPHVVLCAGCAESFIVKAVEGDILCADPGGKIDAEDFRAHRPDQRLDAQIIPVHGFPPVF